MSTILRKAGIVATLFFGAGVVVFAACIAIVFFSGSGSMRPLTDASGKKITASVSGKIRVPINGVEQGMIIKSRNPANPILLFVHGGPGNPSYPLDRQYPSGLEDHFTVCWWDQRGAFLSWSKDIPPESMTVEQLTLDTIAVTQYLCERFRQDKIYLMGHSWGTYIAIRAAQSTPELFHAYIAMSQLVRPIESEKLACAYLLDTAQKAGDTALAEKLGRVSFDSGAGLPADYAKLRDPAMHRFGVGTTHSMKSVFTGYIVPLLLHPEYSLGEKVGWMRGMMLTRASGLPDVRWTLDVPSEVPSLNIPVYFFSGAYDYTCSVPLVREYFRSIKAPQKGFYLFENSAHSPVFEEPDAANNILTEDVLAGKTDLATER